MQLLINKPVFGIEDYSPQHKSLSRSVIQVAKQNLKRETFCVTEPKIKTYIPGVATYDLTWDWSKVKPVHK